MVFMDYADTSFDPVQFFDRFHSERFSDTQADEIRNIIKAAMQNREYVPEPVKEEEPVIVNNEVVKTTELPLLLDENIINGIMKHDRFFKVKRDEIAEFFKENEDYDKRCEFMKSVFRMEEYTELDVNDVRAGYKAEADGLTVWEGSYLSRTKESKLSWDLVQSFTADLIDKGKYLDEKPKLAVEDVKPSNDLHIRSFSEQDGQIFAEVVQGEKSSVAPVKRTDENIPYIEIGGKPHKLTDIQNYDLEQFEIFRSPVTHDVNGYYADASRMYIVGKASPEAEKLVRVTKECMELGVQAIRPWHFLGDIGAACEAHAHENGYSVVTDLGGHGVGKDFHLEPFVPHVGEKDTGMLLVPGMILTVEPMINEGSYKVVVDKGDGWTVRTKDGKLSAQWENTVLVTETGTEVLSS